MAHFRYVVKMKTAKTPRTPSWTSTLNEERSVRVMMIEHNYQMFSLESLAFLAPWRLTFFVVNPVGLHTPPS